MKVVILLLIALVGLVFILPNIFNRSSASDETKDSHFIANVKFLDIEEKPEQTIFEYISLSREGRFTELEELITLIPESFSFVTPKTGTSEEKKQRKRVFIGNEEIVEADGGQIFDVLSRIGLTDAFPKLFEGINSDIKEVKITNKEIKENDARIRVNVERWVGIQRLNSINEEYVFLLRKESKKWKIFFITESAMYKYFNKKSKVRRTQARQ